MTEGMEDFTAGPAPSPGTASPTCSTLNTGPVPEEKPEETEAAGESEEERVKGIAEGGVGGNEEHVGDLEIVALPGTCCVCIEVEQINHCLHSEKICILPILACLLSLALCTAGLKWVFVDKIFEYEPPTHLDPKPIGQDPIIISVDPTLGITVSIPHSTPSTVSLTTTIAITPGHPEVFVEEKSVLNAEHPMITKQSPHPQTTQEFNNIIQTISTTSISTTTKTSSHIMRCSDSQKNYCVNGGECFTLEVMPGSTKFLCRCPNEFTGDRCQNYVMASFYKAEELYQKRILTITGICIALLVVGIMCVVAYCKTKKQRKKLHERLRQSQRNMRKNNTSSGIRLSQKCSTTGHQISNVLLQDLKLIDPCNGMMMQCATEDSETTFPTSKYASSHDPTTFTHISSQRFVSAMRNLIQLSSESQPAPTSPGSPSSDISASLSSLAISVPSVALSPSVQEDHLLLLAKRSQAHMSTRVEQIRSFSQSCYGHVAHSFLSSPVLNMQNFNYRIINDHNITATIHSFSALLEK
ncbi:pro-neuregulin-1, membrane-bound isoform isoform X1 [Leuresthes tenuis]|uniref:pro-neuregulin-1, membrane-bound isoform isoform X1 n=1 Tax=Leuresthes tenuis TaxID=355514 RepID=UPI003B5073D5